MLQPADRRLLFDALSPPSGYKLDFAIGTTYTLDLLAMLSAPVAFAFSDWQDKDGRPTSDPLAILKAVREYADRICLFYEAGGIRVPQTYQPLLASIESSLVETFAPRGGSFHPKVWFLRFEDVYGEVMYRFLCLSRNMTFDRSWDTMLNLEGVLSNRTNAFAQNHPLGRFVEALPKMAKRGVTKTWLQRFEQVAYEIRRVDFELPESVDQIQFWPIGIDDVSDPAKDWPFRESKRKLVISPFVSGSALRDLASPGSQIELVSRADQLEKIKPEVLSTYSNVWILDDMADPEPSDTDETNPVSDEPSESDSRGALSNAPALVGLHAKLYVLDDGWDASVLTGSANATYAAFNRNVEFLTVLRGKKSKMGVAAILGEPSCSEDKKTGAASLADLLRPFKISDDCEEGKSAEETFERLVDEIAKQFAKAQLIAHCQDAVDGDGYRVCIQPIKRIQVTLDSTVTVSIRPASRPHASFESLDVHQPIWAEFNSLAMLSLTSFYVFRVETDLPKKMTREFVLNIPLRNEPSGRREALLKSLLSDQKRVLRFLMMLLSDADAEAFSNLFNGTDGESESFLFSSLLNDQPLFEAMIRWVGRDPARLEQVAEVLCDLKNSPDGRQLLPEHLDAIWEPIWNVAQRQLAKGSRQRKV